MCFIDIYKIEFLQTNINSMKRFTNSFFLLMCLLILPSFLMAQRTITGQITDAETGENLIAVNIVVAGTTDGTSSDIEGKYSITLPDGATELTFSYTGYGTQTIAVGATNVLDVRMTAGENIKEVLVIGYGEIKKDDATGSIVSVTSEDFNQGAITSVQDLVAGKLAGVAITPSADPGGGASIRIRGLSSLTASNDPLVVVDGVPLEQNSIGGSRNFLNIINPNDIESINVLKDASAAAIYGSRASGGVIIITTKKGKGSDRFQLNYNGNVSMSQVTRFADVLNADEFRTLVTESDEADEALLGDDNTDWQSQIYQNEIGTDHNINMSGGIRNLPYRLSVGYTNKDGVVKTDKFERTTVGLNLNPKFLDNTLQINFSTKAMFSNNRFADRGAIGAATRFDPTQPVTSTDPVLVDNYGGYFAYVTPAGTPLGLAPTNPVAMLDLREDVASAQKYIVNGSIDYRMPFLPELRANLSMGIDAYDGEGTVIVQPEMAYAYDDTGSITDYWNRNRNEVLEFYLNYAKDFSFGNLDVMTGYSWQHFLFDNYTFSRNLPENEIYREDQEPREYYLVSLFGRVNYSFKNFLFTFTLRRDGSSRFAPDARWGLFPSTALAYKVIDNKEGFLNNLKIRTGYGITGQQDIGNGFNRLYQYLPLYNLSEQTARYQLGNQFFNVLRPEGYDANLQWEEAATLNLALDFTILDNKINGSIDFYQRSTTDLLLEVDVPAGTNLTNRLVTNVGDMRNSGIELTLNATPINKSDFTWDIGANATYEQNEVTSLLLTDDPSYFQEVGDNISGGIDNQVMIWQVGLPAYTFYLHEQLYDADGNPLVDENGNPQYADRNGDGDVDENDRYAAGNPNANWFFGINSNITYKNFGLAFSGRANLGNTIYNNVFSATANETQLQGNTAFLSNVNRNIFETNFIDPALLSDYYIQDGSFFRLDYITLSYTLPELGKFTNLRLALTAQNLVTVSNYQGLDPEAGWIDNNPYPRPRTIMLGLSGSF